jgi:hypothetical protein
MAGLKETDRVSTFFCKEVKYAHPADTVSHTAKKYRGKKRELFIQLSVIK